VSAAAEAVAAIRTGKTVVLPFDTVYGLAADLRSEDAVRGLYALKGRAAGQPSALVAATLEDLLDCVPELSGKSEALARSLLPGPFTLVLPNPAHRFRWITGAREGTIGVRVPGLDGVTRAVLEQVGAVVATSANRPGDPDPRSLSEVPEEIRAGAAAVVDGGELPGTPSTVVDLTGAEPELLREGAVPAAEVVRRLNAAVRST
jgi:L-threonylcarbamoyladenylate synthase